MDTRRAALLRWFAHAGDRYVEEYLGPSHWDVNRLRSDACYGLRLFLSRYAYERNGAPRGFRIAAVKAVATAWPDVSRVPDEYRHYYGGKRFERGNPAFDPALVNLDIPSVIAAVEAGHLPDAFTALRLRGVGTKIRSLFLRDIVAVTQSEARLATLRDHLYCQPIDVWVEMSVRALELSTPADMDAQSWQALGLSHTHGVVAAALITAAREADVSPLRVNQGMWYFCAKAVADATRLDALVRTGDAADLSRELELVQL